ncbi:hypothetical protein [Candidatus Methylomirabilis sp.]|uniref:hypothetical protein n=1 Tax=Candidatus Methylomirabilis sp. TaxID=2032687 RepID=UPI003076008C
MTPSRTPALSLILCSRNDQYMGNSRWRLQTTLNYVAQRVHELDREEDVEVLVADWGSDIPLREVVELSPAAARMVSFILIPPGIARDLQQDSPFPEVLALNAAARRAGGEYIGRIDQDTLVGKRFLQYFFDLYEGRRQLDVPLTSALLFANVRMVPYRLSVRCPSFWTIDKYINCFWRFLKIQFTSRITFYRYSVGIWLLHRDLWNACGGYDERMIYMNDMEVNMIERLMKNHKVVNLGKLVDYDFYHLEHYHPLAPRRSSTYRMVNPWSPFAQPDICHPNGPDWGLVQYPFETLPCSPDRNKDETATLRQSPLEWLFFILLMVSAGIQIASDKLIKSVRMGNVVWRRRTATAWETVRCEPLVRWPRLLISLWVRKKHDQRQERQKYLQ